MNALTFWILESVAESYMEVLFMETSGRETLQEMARPRGVTNEQVVVAMDELFQSGDIYAWTTKDGTRFGEIIDAPRPTRPEIAYALKDLKRRYVLGFGLTAQGGHRWEEAAQAQWELYTEYSRGDDWIEVVRSEAGSVEEHITYARAQGVLIEASVERKILTPWQATYWKTLPSGHQIRFQQQKGGGSLSNREWYQRPGFGTTAGL